MNVLIYQQVNFVNKSHYLIKILLDKNSKYKTR